MSWRNLLAFVLFTFVQMIFFFGFYIFWNQFFFTFNFLGPKRFWTSNFFGPKHFFTKFFEPNIFWSKYFFIKTYLDPIIFWSKFLNISKFFSINFCHTQLQLGFWIRAGLWWEPEWDLKKDLTNWRVYHFSFLSKPQPNLNST